MIYIYGNDWPGTKTSAHYYDDHQLVELGADSCSAWLFEKLKSIAAVRNLFNVEYIPELSLLKTAV